MKKRLLLMVVIIVGLVLGTVFVAYAGSKGKITGSMKAVYGTGYNWFQVNIHVDPSGEPSGFAKYRSWTEAPNEWGYWIAEPICVSFVEYGGMPAAILVTRFTEDDEDLLVGQYAKSIIVDSGSNAKNDMLGLVVWPPVNDELDCSYQEPFWLWSGVGGNITIHNPKVD